MKLYLLSGLSANYKEFNFISDYLTELEPVFVYSDKSRNGLIRWTLGGAKIIKVAKSGDIVVCFLDIQAVILYFISLLFVKKINIVAVNVLLKVKDTWLNKIVRQVYKIAFMSNRFYPTVTSEKYGEYIKRCLGVDKKMHLLHDMFIGYVFPFDGEVEAKSIFCGGRNGRDWGFVLEIARQMPDYKFNLVMPRSFYEIHKSNLQSNIHVFVDVGYYEFMSILCKSQIVGLPLDTQSPAGLIVIFQGADNQKFIIASDNLITNEYIDKQTGMLLKNNVSDWVSGIKEAFTNIEINEKRAIMLREKLREMCSKEKYALKLKDIIYEIKRKA